LKSSISADLALRVNKIKSEYKRVTWQSPASSIFDKAIRLHKNLKTELFTMRKKPLNFDFSIYEKINFGCGYDKREGYLNVDSDPACDPDFLIPIGDLSLLPKHHFKEVLAKDVLEHIPRAKSLDALLEFSSLLCDGGTLFLQTSSITKGYISPRFSHKTSSGLCYYKDRSSMQLLATHPTV
jgi:hypothetical protein